MANVSKEKYEELLRILENQNGRTYTFEEAKEIGDGLVDFYTLLTELYNEDSIKYTAKYSEYS